MGLCQAAHELLHAVRGTRATHLLCACCRAEAQPCEKAFGLEMLGGNALMFGIARLLSLPACLEHTRMNSLCLCIFFSL